MTIDEKRRQVGTLVEALNARDLDAIAAMPFFDAETTEFNSAISEGETYLGVGGLREWARNVDEIWDAFRVELVRVEDAGDDRAAVELHTTAVARASGVPLDTRTGQVWTWRGGVAVRNDSYTDPRQAFEAAGVPYGPRTRSR